MVVSTGYDGRLRLWSVAAYHEERVLPGLALRGHVDAVMAARFSSDGRSIVTASRDRTAKKWRVADGTEELTFREGHAYLTSKAIFFPDGQRLMTAAVDGTVRIWSLAAGTELRKIEGTGYRAAVALSTDGRWILTGATRPRAAARCDPVGAATVGRRPSCRKLPGHKVAVTSVALSPDGKLAFTGDDNGVGNLWDPASGRHIEARIPPGADHRRGLLADGRRLFTASSDKTVCPWDLTDLAQPAKHSSNSSGIPAGDAIAIAPDNRDAVTGCEDGRPGSSTCTSP